MQWLKACLAVVCITISGAAKAGVVDPPIVTETFPSGLQMELLLLNAWTGIGDIPASIVAQGPTTIQREQGNNAFLQGGLDTIDTEIVDMQLTGSSDVGPFPIEIRVGEGNGFFPGLTRSGGQVQDLPVSPVDGNIDFPADSIFDVFFDIWVDLNTDSIVDVGEVLRNGGQQADTSLVGTALRMRNPNLSSLPPNLYGQDPYGSAGPGGGGGVIDILDPNIGMFNATPVPGLLDLHVVDALGNLGPVHATLDPTASHKHTPNPEPGSLALLGVGLAGFAAQRRRKKKQRQDA